jgi:hypothetical protein
LFPRTTGIVAETTVETRARKKERGVGGAGEGVGGSAARAGGSSGAMAVGGHPLEGPSEKNEDDADAAPSELLGPLLEEWREVLVKHVLERLEPTDCAVLAQVGKAWLAVVLANNLPRAGTEGAVKLKLVDFLGSVERLAWAKENGCPWEQHTCALIAGDGRLDVLQWARDHDCPWNEDTCELAALGGHLEVLKWARESHCPWNERTCANAAAGGHLEVLMWAWEHGCPWGMGNACEDAAAGGHLEVLKWLREQDCEWGTLICKYAAQRGHLEMLQWAREHGCPWQPLICVQYADARGHVELAQWVRDQPDYDEDVHSSEEW